MKIVKAFVIFFAVYTVCVIGIVLARPMQTQSSLTVGGFTLSVPSANPPVLVQSPIRNGTMALKEDLTTAPAIPIAAGMLPVNGVVNLSPVTNPVCTVTPRYTVSGSTLTVTGIDYVCTAKTN